MLFDVSTVIEALSTIFSGIEAVLVPPAPIAVTKKGPLILT